MDGITVQQTICQYADTDMRLEFSCHTLKLCSNYFFSWEKLHTENVQMEDRQESVHDTGL